MFIERSGLEFSNLTERATRDYETSQLINAPLIDIMMLQATNLANKTESKNILPEQSSLKIAALNKKIEEVEKLLPKDTYCTYLRTN